MAVNWTKVRNDFDAVIEAEGIASTVTLRGGGSFSIKAVKRHRRAAQDMTEGLQQQLPSVSVMAHRWDTGAGRPPQKGDQIMMGDRRYIVEDWNSVIAGDVDIGYNMAVKG